MMDAHAAAFPAALTGISHPLSTASSPVTEHPLSYKLTSLALYRLSSTEHKNTISNNEMRQTLFPGLWSSFLDNHTALKTNDLLPVFLRNYLLVEPEPDFSGILKSKSLLTRQTNVCIDLHSFTDAKTDPLPPKTSWKSCPHNSLIFTYFYHSYTNISSLLEFFLILSLCLLFLSVC